MSYRLELYTREIQRTLGLGDRLGSWAKLRPPARLRRAAGCLLETFDLAEDEIYGSRPSLSRLLHANYTQCKLH